MKKKLQEELQRVMGQLTTLRAVTDPTEEQNTEIDALAAEALELTSKISEAAARDARLDALQASLARSVNPLPAGGPAPLPGAALATQRTIIIPATAKRKAPAHFESAEQAFAFGQWCRAAIGDNRTAREWCSNHGIALRTQVESDNVKGGYLVPSEFGAVIDALQAEYGILRQYATISVMSSDTKDHPKRPLSAVMKPARERRDNSGDKDADFGNVALVAKKFMDFYEMSSELDEDAAIDVASELATVIASSASLTEDLCGFMGDGTGTVYHKITGIFNAINNVGSNVGQKTATAVTTYLAITEAMLINLKAALPSAADQNGDAAWYCTSKALTEVFERLALAKGGVTAAEIIAGAAPRFLGKPIRVVEAITNNETSGGFALIYGSLRKGVVLGDRRALTIRASEEAGFRTDTTQIRVTCRFDVAVHEPGTSSAAGALVALKFG
jgi:HK97 family phage major capsid protein